jgi:hypothetical protein
VCRENAKLPCAKVGVAHPTSITPEIVENLFHTLCHLIPFARTIAQDDMIQAVRTGGQEQKPFLANPKIDTAFGRVHWRVQREFAIWPIRTAQLLERASRLSLENFGGVIIGRRLILNNICQDNGIGLGTEVLEFHVRATRASIRVASHHEHQKQYFNVTSQHDFLSDRVVSEEREVWCSLSRCWELDIVRKQVSNHHFKRDSP